MIVMMMAMTPSLNAVNRSLRMAFQLLLGIIWSPNVANLLQPDRGAIAIPSSKYLCHLQQIEPAFFEMLAAAAWKLSNRPPPFAAVQLKHRHKLSELHLTANE